MRHFAVIGATISACILCGGCSRDATSIDLEALNGEWAWVAIESQGETTSPEEIKGQGWLIQGKMITARAPGGGDHQIAFELDAAKTPKEMDLLPQYAPYQGQRTRAIYTLESGKLRVCVADSNKESPRPTEFTDAMVFEKVVQ